MVIAGFLTSRVRGVMRRGVIVGMIGRGVICIVMRGSVEGLMMRWMMMRWKWMRWMTWMKMRGCLV